MALRVISRQCSTSVAWCEADMHWQMKPADSVENDPTLPSGANFAVMQHAAFATALVAPGTVTVLAKIGVKSTHSVVRPGRRARGQISCPMCEAPHRNAGSGGR
jgi:hypothetical protein